MHVWYNIYAYDALCVCHIYLSDSFFKFVVKSESNRGYNKSGSFFPEHISKTVGMKQAPKISHIYIYIVCDQSSSCLLIVCSQLLRNFCAFHPIPKLWLPILNCQHQWSIPVWLDALLLCWVCLRIECLAQSKKQLWFFQQFPT